MSDTIVVRLKRKNSDKEKDIAIDNSITGQELINAINSAYGLAIEGITMDNPPGYIHGSKTLVEYGIHNASILLFD